MIRIDGRKAWTAMHFVDQREEVPGSALRGFLVEPTARGLLLVAADGRRMAVLEDARGEAEEPVVIRLEKPALRWLKPRTRLFIDEDGSHKAFGVSKQVPLFDYAESCIHGEASTFPDWRRVVVGGLGPPNAGPMDVDLDQLASFRYLWSEPASTKAPRGLRISQARGGTILLCNHEPDRFGILMPIEPFPGGQRLASVVTGFETEAPPADPPDLLAHDSDETVPTVESDPEPVLEDYRDSFDETPAEEPIYEGSTGLPDPKDVMKKG